MLYLLAGITAFSLGAHGSARARNRVRPNNPRRRRLDKLKTVNPTANNRITRQLIQIQNDPEQSCECR